MADDSCYVFSSKTKIEGERYKVDVRKDSEYIECRKALYSKIWGRLENRINQEIGVAHARSLRDVETFVSSASPEQYGGKIPSALIVTGPSASTDLFDEIQSLILKDPKLTYVSLAPTESSNLKSLLRNVISKATQPHDGQPFEDERPSSVPGPRFLNYDLEILHDWCNKHGIEKVVIDLQNSEGFDVAILTDFILLLHPFITRLTIVLLFDIATSVEEFQERLPNAATRCLQGEIYDIEKADEIVERIFETAVTDVELGLGPSFVTFILQRARDNIQNIESFKQAIKYAYMCHFYGNSTSIFLDINLKAENASPEVFDAIRNLPSFRAMVEDLLNSDEGQLVRSLLESDEALLGIALTHVRKLRDVATWMVGALRVLRDLKYAHGSKKLPSISMLYSKALAGSLASSSILEETLSSVRNISSEKLSDVLPKIYDTLMTMPASDNQISPDDIEDIRNDLDQLLSYSDSTAVPIQAYETESNQGGGFSKLSNKTEVQGHKKQAATNASAYTELVSRFHILLQNYFRTSLVNFKDRFPYEIVFYDTKALHNNALTPRPRFALERALSSPHDYLGCSCCVKSVDGMISTQPYTAILYQLYLESGVLINVFDLWSAFKEIVSRHHEEDQLVMALFFRSLAALRYMGMLKPSRKRIDHLGKTMWGGL